MSECWKELVLLHADGRQVCNCGWAYYDATGRCAWGCSANQIRAREDIACRILAGPPAKEPA